MNPDTGAAEHQTSVPEHHLMSMGPTEDQVDMRDTVPQRIDPEGTKIEDLAGTGEQDTQGG